MSRLFTNFTRVCLRVYASLRQVVPLMQAQLMLMRKRPLTLILLILLGCGFILTTGFHLALYAFAILPVTSNTCPATSSQQGGQSVPCFTETPQQQEQQKLLRQEVLREQKNALAFPASSTLAGDTLLSLGALLLCIFVAVLIGSDYQFGTQRLIFLRGVSLPRFALAQLAVLLLILLPLSGLMLAAGVLARGIIDSILGARPIWPSPQEWEELLLYGLGITLSMWIYALLASLITTLGRSVGAGIAGSIGYLFVQSILLPTLASFTSALPNNAFTALLTHLPSAFLATASKTLLNALASTPIALSSSAPPSIATASQAVAVLLCYILLCIGGSFWLVKKRDVAA